VWPHSGPWLGWMVTAQKARRCGPLPVPAQLLILGLRNPSLFCGRIRHIIRASLRIAFFSLERAFLPHKTATLTMGRFQNVIQPETPVRHFIRQLTNWNPSAPLEPWKNGFIVFQGLLVFAFAFGIKAVFASHGIDLHHDGIMFKPALDVAQGKMVFRDTFTQYGGLTVLMQAAAIKLFGESLLAIRMQTALMYGLSFYVFWLVWRRVIPSLLATFVCLVGSIMGPDSIATPFPWSSVYALFFQGLALLCAVRYVERGRERELFYSGGAAALSFWCRQPVGVFLAAGLSVTLAIIFLRMPPGGSPSPRAFSVRSQFGSSRYGRVCRALLGFGGGFVILNGIVLLWLTRYRALGDWWKQSIEFAIVWSKRVGEGHSTAQIFNCLFPSGDLRVWTLLAVPVAVQALRSIAPFLDPKASSHRTATAIVLLMSTVGITSWLQYYPVACNYHCYWASIPMLGVFAYLFYSSHIGGSTFLRSLMAVIVVGLVFYKDVSWRIESTKPRIKSENLLVQSIPTLRGMRTNQQMLWSFNAFASLLDAYHRAHPDGVVVTTTNQALLPALASKQATLPLHVNWSDWMFPLYPQAEPIRLEYIRENLPMVVGPINLPTYIRVASVCWDHLYDISVPKDTHPTEFIECDGSGPCQQRPLQ